MKIVSKIMICLVAAIICMGATSCKKDTTIRYNNTTMGNVEGNTFISDQGNIFNVVEQDKSCKGDLMTLKRAYIMCDILNKTEGGLDNEYDVRLNAMAQVTTKDILSPGTDIEEEKLKEDPINIEYLWISSGYINMFVTFPAKADSKTAHMINLIQKESEKGYTFRLTHNAYGEIIENGNIAEFVMAGGYASFPISKLIQENEALIRIEWTWYKTIGSGISQETELLGVEGTYRRDGFEHTPKELNARTLAIIK